MTTDVLISSRTQPTLLSPPYDAPNRLLPVVDVSNRTRTFLWLLHSLIVGVRGTDNLGADFGRNFFVGND